MNSTNESFTCNNSEINKGNTELKIFKKNSILSIDDDNGEQNIQG